MSLRWRLMLSVAAVVLASLAAVAYISSRVVRVELNQMKHFSGPVSPEEHHAIARSIASRFETSGLDGMHAHLLQVRNARHPQSELLFLDLQNRLLATSAPAVENVEISERPEGATRIRIGRGSTLSEIVVRGRATPVVVPGKGVVGSLLVTPRWQGPLPRDPMNTVNRWLLLAVAVVGLAALGFTALVAHRIIAPIEQLQEATARVRGGALGERVAVTTRDEVGQLAEAFNAMTGRLKQDEELRRNLVSDVAHELRTPLTNLRASIEAIQDGLRTPDGSVIDSLHDDVLLLQRLVEDLQTLALAEAGQLPLHVERVNLREELDRFARAQNEPRLSSRVEGECFASVDRVRLQQILSNLVRNALAHITSEGHIVITAASLNPTTTRINVADDGSGIPAADLPHVFNRFYRADSSRTRATGGAGLGLAIVRQLVENHGGHISVESTTGTRFTLDLPSS